MARCVVKIAISSVSYFHMDDVVYYRSGMTPDFVVRWRWFFDYLAALVKVNNPHRNVVFYTGPQSEDIRLGKEWYEHRKAVMLKTANRVVNRLKAMPVESDLFGYNASDRDRQLEEWTNKIALLEADKYPIPGFPEYINKVKEYVRYATK